VLQPRNTVSCFLDDLLVICQRRLRRLDALEDPFQRVCNLPSSSVVLAALQLRGNGVELEDDVGQHALRVQELPPDFSRLDTKLVTTRFEIVKV
jgi:hypothetical protein